MCGSIHTYLPCPTSLMQLLKKTREGATNRNRADCEVVLCRIAYANAKNHIHSPNGLEQWVADTLKAPPDREKRAHCLDDTKERQATIHALAYLCEYILKRCNKHQTEMPLVFLCAMIGFFGTYFDFMIFTVVVCSLLLVRVWTEVLLPAGLYIPAPFDAPRRLLQSTRACIPAGGRPIYGLDAGCLPG